MLLVIGSHGLAAVAEASLVVHHDDPCYLPLSGANLILAITLLVKLLVKQTRLRQWLGKKRIRATHPAPRTVFSLCPLALLVVILCYLTKVSALGILFYIRHHWAYLVLLTSELVLTGEMVAQWFLRLRHKSKLSVLMEARTRTPLPSPSGKLAKDPHAGIATPDTLLREERQRGAKRITNIQKLSTEGTVLEKAKIPST
jgi:hypothetical protein